MTPAPGSADAPGHLDKNKRVDLADLLPRLLSALVLIALAVTTALLGGVAFAVLWGLAGAAILWEWQRLIGPEGANRRVVPGIAAVLAATVATAVDHPGWAALALLCGAAVVAVQSARLQLGDVHTTRAATPTSSPLPCGEGDASFHRVMHQSGPMLGAAGVIYAGLLPVAVVILRRSEAFGLEAVFWLFAVVWGTDVMAYFGGRLVGGPRLWPRVSPSKTWSGFLIGVGSGALAGCAVAALDGRGHWALLPLGIMAGMVAQGGDLFESSLKRQFGAKDSSRLIPGHGGVMDRLDGFLAAAVFAAAFGTARLGLDGAAAGLLQW